MNAKEKILNLLSKRKIENETTTRIAGTLGFNYKFTLEKLKELESENKIETVKVGKYTGWKIK